MITPGSSYDWRNFGEHVSAVRVARPFWIEQDPSILGRPFFVLEKMNGRVPVSVPPYATQGWLSEASPAERRRLWDGAVRQLAAVQTVPVADVAFLAEMEPAGDGLAQEWEKYSRFVEWLRDDPRHDILEASRQRLLSMWPENQPDGLVWGDARIGNMMFDENFDVIAVMDWEQPSLGGALHDLAWFITLSEMMHGPHASLGAPLEGMGTREETIAMWEKISGKSAADLVWYEEFTRLKLSCTAIRLANLRGNEGIERTALASRLNVG